MQEKRVRPPTPSTTSQRTIGSRLCGRSQSRRGGEEEEKLAMKDLDEKEGGDLEEKQGNQHPFFFPFSFYNVMVNCELYALCGTFV